MLDDILDPPYDLIDCSWPRPVEVDAEQRWISPPEWDAPLMPFRPQPHWELHDHLPTWVIDWRRFFEQQMQSPGNISGQMRNFHIVFRVRVRRAGSLIVWSDDGCLIRRRGELLVEEAGIPSKYRQFVRVEEGDVLEIALRQHEHFWFWGAGRYVEPISGAEAVELLSPFAERAAALVGSDPSAPALKVYTDGSQPYRLTVAVLSAILNGFAPSRVLLYGDHQWPEHALGVIRAFLPFAEVVSTDGLLDRIEALGGPELRQMAKHWWVPKTWAALLEGPDECVCMDDDVLVIGSVADALAAFRTHDLVYGQDFIDLAEPYLAMWVKHFPREAPLVTGRLNAGFYLIRHREGDRDRVADAMLDRDPAALMAHFAQHGRSLAPWDWEQGLIATLYADGPTYALPPGRYVDWRIEGFPGGFLGYDYAANPCGFATVHLVAGYDAKPTDLPALALANRLLAPRSK